MITHITGFSDLRGRFEEYRFPGAVAARVQWLEDRQESIGCYSSEPHCPPEKHSVPYSEIQEGWFLLRLPIVFVNEQTSNPNFGEWR